MASKRQRATGPLDGGDVFGTPDRTRQNTRYLGRAGDDSNDFWSNLDERNRQHRQHVKWLVVAMVLISIPGILVHTGFFQFALILVIPVTVELLMIRQTRSRTKIPDYRPPEQVEVTLEGRRDDRIDVHRDGTDPGPGPR